MPNPICIKISLRFSTRSGVGDYTQPSLSGEVALRDIGDFFIASVKERDYNIPSTSNEMEELGGVNQLASKLIRVSNIFPGYREPEIGESSLGVVLDSLVPDYRETQSPTPLPVYQGRTVIGKKGIGGEASSSEQREKGSGKEYAWSRGLGIEFSLVKTMSV